MASQQGSSANQSASANPASPATTSPARAMEEPDSGTVSKAKAKVQELASQARQTASDQINSGLTQGMSRAAEALGVLSQSLVASSQQLREGNQETIGDYVEQAAQRVERVSSYLRDADAGRMTSDLEDFARRRPALFLGAAFALGAFGARFLKSTQRQDRAAAMSRLGVRGTSGRGDGWDREASLPTGTDSWRPGTSGR